jgi:hypothetical protein
MEYLNAFIVLGVVSACLPLDLSALVARFDALWNKSHRTHFTAIRNLGTKRQVRIDAVGTVYSDTQGGLKMQHSFNTYSMFVKSPNAREHTPAVLHPRLHATERLVDVNLCLHVYNLDQIEATRHA